MDIRCRKCGEPWDTDCLHDVVEEGLYGDFDAAFAAFRRRGCVALAGEYYGVTGADCVPMGSDRRMIVDAVYELMGDDVDGAASTFEDAEWIGLL